MNILIEIKPKYINIYYKKQMIRKLYLRIGAMDLMPKNTYLMFNGELFENEIKIANLFCSFA